MIPEDRKYHFLGELIVKRSRVLSQKSYPKDDTVNWLFLKFCDRRFSFIYKIENPSKAMFEEPFNIYLSFIMEEVVKDLVKLQSNYEVLRGEEPIGHVRLLLALS